MRNTASCRAAQKSGDQYKHQPDAVKAGAAQQAGRPAAQCKAKTSTKANKQANKQKQHSTARTCSGSGMPTTLMERRVRRYSSALLTPRRSKQLDWDR